MSDDETILETVIDKGTLDQTLDILETLASEAVLRFGKDGLDVALVDPANVAMHWIDIEAEAFDSVPTGEVAVGIDLDRLSEAIGKAGSDQLVTLGYGAATRMLHVSYGNVDVKIAAIDIDNIRNPPDDVDLDLPNSFVIESDVFQDALEVAEMVSDNVKIDCKPEDEAIEVLGTGDLDNATVTLGHEDVVSASVAEETRSMYSTDYLLTNGNEAGGIVTAMPDTEVEVTIGDEFPVELEYSYAEGHAEVMTRLAPRIVSE